MDNITQKSKEDLIKERDKINSQIAAINPNSVFFSVDANIINRLGKELVGRAETAVSELVKNAYDADAKLVKLDFIDSFDQGGKLIIDDDGHGMNIQDVIKGFMTLSSTSKVHEPLSPKYNRHRAGRKGIGRFATQFLGEKLTIITQTLNSESAIKVVINWNSYEMDKDLSSIENHIEIVDKIKEHGTTLYIESLRHSWTDAQIKRVFRYVSDLLQPAFLSINSEKLKIANQSDEFFLVECYRTENGLKSIIADLNKILFGKSLAIIEGYVDNSKYGNLKLNSSSFNIKDVIIPINSNEKGGDLIEPYEKLKNIHFIAYYFIYSRQEYYTNGISKLELANVEDLAAARSGIRMYRNGFRVLPYGEIGDDWLGLDRKRSKIDIELENEKLEFNIPYSNKNFFGFVEVIDKEGICFEETASREGLIENESLNELKDFIRKTIIAGVKRIAPYVYKEKKNRDTKIRNNKTIKEKVLGIQSKIDEFTNYSNTDNSNSEKSEELKFLFSDLETDLKDILDELAMLRILATLGITIGEFTHEIIQFPVFFNSKLKSLLLSETNLSKRESLNQVLDKINHLDTYTSYFNDAVSRNSKRELECIELRRVIRPFIESSSWDFEHERIVVEEEIIGYDLFTCPMHPSEWHSILLNLYTNSKKALRRAKPLKKKIKIKAGKTETIVFLEFSDNGDGISKEYEERIFDAFFTTSTPAGMNAKPSEQMTGSGLGLKILKDIVNEYKGQIYLTAPDEEYKTCFRIEIPMASDKQIEELEK